MQGLAALISLLINGLVAIGTLAAVVVALFGDWIRFRLVSPSVDLVLLDPEGEGPVPFQSPNGVISDVVRWYHVRVSNGRRWFKLTEADLRLLRVEELPEKGVDWLTRWKGEVPIRCRNQDHFPTRHTIGTPVDFDVCRVHKNGSFFLRPLISPAGLEMKWQGPLRLKLTFQAKSAEADSRLLSLQILWDGNWHDGEKEMQDHFKIKEE